MRNLSLMKSLFALGLSLSLGTPFANGQEDLDLNIQINRMGESVYDTSDVTLQWTDDSHTALSIINFNGSSGTNLFANVDEYGNVSIPFSMAGMDYNTYNFYMIVPAEDADKGIYELSNSKLTGTYDGTTLTLNPWNLVITDYTFSANLGTVYESPLTSKFVISNAEMSAVNEFDYTWTNNLFAEVIDDKQVAIYNWAGFGYALLNGESGKWVIDSQIPSLTYNGSQYFIQPVNANQLEAEDNSSNRTLYFGSWNLANSEGRNLRETVSTSVNFSFELPDLKWVNLQELNLEIIDVVYYNLQGHKSDKPFKGVNIVKKYYKDGSEKVIKVIK